MLWKLLLNGRHRFIHISNIKNIIKSGQGKDFSYNLTVQTYFPDLYKTCSKTLPNGDVDHGGNILGHP